MVYFLFTKVKSINKAKAFLTIISISEIVDILNSLPRKQRQ